MFNCLLTLCFSVHFINRVISNLVSKETDTKKKSALIFDSLSWYSSPLLFFCRQLCFKQNHVGETLIDQNVWRTGSNLFASFVSNNFIRKAKNNISWSETVLTLLLLWLLLLNYFLISPFYWWYFDVMIITVMSIFLAHCNVHLIKLLYLTLILD